MSQLLHIDASIQGEQSFSRQLSAQIVDAWRTSHPATQVSYLDLALDTPAHLSADALGFRRPAGAAALSPQQVQENALSEALVSQFLAADIIVIGAPMYNFTIPSQLKAWIDRVAQGGRTFTYTEQGLVGLAGGKTVIVASTRGGMYSTSDAGQAMEHQESYLKTVFGFFGITDIRFVRAEGLDMGPDSRQAALQHASAALSTIATAPTELKRAA